MTFPPLLTALPKELKALMREGFSRSVEQNSNVLEKELRKGPTTKDRNGYFLSHYLEGYLEELEASTFSDKDKIGHLTAMLTAEFQIFKYNCRYPLTENPYLPHFVQAAARIQTHHAEQGNTPQAWRARMEIIALALTSPGVRDGLKERGSKNMEQRSPDSIFEKTSSFMTKIKLAPFVAMMEKMGLGVGDHLRAYLKIEADQNDYTDGDLTLQVHIGAVSEDIQQNFFKSFVRTDCNGQHQASRSSSSEDEPDSLSKGKSAIPSLVSIAPRSSVDNIKQALRTSPEETAHTLSRFPLDLRSLNTLTDILTDSSIIQTTDTATITREYIQHSLRLLERSGNPFSPSSDAGSDEHDDAPNGSEERARAVTLLVKFMTNLIRKGRLDLDELAFDIHEICVRYLWVSEVRDFKRFFEGGEVLGAEAGTKQGG